MIFASITSASSATNVGVAIASPNGGGGGGGVYVGSVLDLHGFEARREGMVHGQDSRWFWSQRPQDIHLFSSGVRFYNLVWPSPSAKARPNEISALFAALAHSPESPSFSAMAKNIGLQLVVFDRRAVNFLLCDSFESIICICHPHWFLIKGSKVGRARDVD